MKRKMLAVLLSTSMIMVALAGCGKKAETNNSKQVDTTAKEESVEAGKEGTTDPVGEEKSIVTEPTTLTYVFADGDEGAKEAMNEIVSRFNDTYKDVTVKIMPGNGGAYSEFIKTMDSVGEFPDIMEMRDTAAYVRAGKLEPLSSEITSLFKTTTEFDNAVYTAPLAGENTQGIIYNKTYFDENGFTEPTTYAEFIELCQKIKEKGDMSPLVVGGQDIWHMGFWYNKAYNDQVISQDPDFIVNTYSGTKDWSDATVKATFEEMKEIMQYAQDGWTSTPDAQITTFFVNKMSAMMFSGTHMFSQIEAADSELEYGWFPVPSPDGKTRLVGGGGVGGLAISAEAAQDANKKAAAEEFIKFFFAPENYKVYCEKLSAIPVTVEEPTIDVSDVFKEVIEATNTADDLCSMWNGQVGNKELPPDFRNFMYKTVIEVLQGQRDVDSACEELNKTWKTCMESFNPLDGTGIQ